MNQLDTTARARVVAALVEGMSIRATCRMTGVAKGTVLKLLADLGRACAEFMDKTLVDLPCKRIQCDEIWSFCYAKDKNVPSRMHGQPGIGSIWTWTAIDADTKLIASFHVGTRDAHCANHFMCDLADRLANRVQLTTDGHKAYLWATNLAFDGDVDYSILVKLYGNESATGEQRYSPQKCIGTRLDVVSGEPDLDHASTSFVERSNLTLRMGSRRFTRLTNAFSKKIENLEYAVAIHFMHYNFCRVHSTIKTTPAMAAGIADHVWTLDEMVALIPEPTRAAWGSKRVRQIGNSN
jgi:IS1 family transposase